MRQIKSSLILRILLLVFVLAASSWHAVAQTATPSPRITQAIDEKSLVTLWGNVHPLARAEFDQGLVAHAQPLKRMLLLLRRSPDQEAALQQLLEDQQNKSSANYHAWLTPDQFGKQFGPADGDIQTVTQWLASHGFTDIKVGPGRNVIEFSGNVAAVRNAFHTEIHRFLVNGEEHQANASDPQIPAALSPVVAGIVSLHNFPRKTMYHLAKTLTRSKEGQVTLVKPNNPELTFQCGNDPKTGQPVYCTELGPYDFAAIYNVLPLWNATPAIDGTGQTIAIANESNINLQDVRDFRFTFGLPANDPVVVLNGPDPGIIPGIETEADLDVELSGGVARGATIKLVVSQSTETSGGVDLSAEYVVDNNLAPILSVSFGDCELNLGTSGNQFYNQLWQQAAAQGISVFVASGDNGAAGCDFFVGQTPQPAQSGLQVSGFASTPYNIAVGGTDFNDFFNATTYWNTTNDPTTQQSAKGYIPETTWNDSCTNAIFGDPRIGFSTNAETNCNNSRLSGFVFTMGGSGGKSSCTTPSGQTPSACAGGYAKPFWQIGPGVPLDGKRDVPDVSLFASNGFVGNSYAICESDVLGFCSSTNLLPIGGTSASAPAFAGIMAMVNQKMQSAQGNANVVFYKLATAQSVSTCNSSTGPAGTCVFNDVTSGTIAMPCAKSSLNCATSNSNDQYGVLSGYNAGPGYDLATGLGSVNVQNLVNNWSSVTFLPSSTTLAATVNGSAVTSITGIAHGTAVGVSSSVTAGSGATGTPTGQVALIATPNPTPSPTPGGPSVSPSLGVEALTLSSGTARNSNVILPGGTYNLTAHYQGDATFGSSDSTPGIPVTIIAETSKTIISIPTFDPATGLETGNTPTSLVYGSPYLARIDVGNAQASLSFPPKPICAPQSCATGTVTWMDSLNGAPATALDGGIFALNSEGYTEDQKIQLSGGSHVLTATYSGDNSYVTSSGAYALTITPATMQLLLTLPTSTVVGMPFVIYMSGTTTVRGAAPMGTLTVYDGTTAIFTASGTGVGGYAGTGSGSTPTAGFGIDTGITLSTVGSHWLTLAYSADPNYSAASTSPQVVRVVYPTTLTLQSSSTTVNYGTSATLTATLTTTQTSPPVTGQITFASSTGQGTVATGPTTQTLINGFVALQATATITPQSSDRYTANYAGDSNYFAASAASPYITVNNPDFSIVPSQPGLTITAGQSGNLTITVTPTYALNSSLQLQVPSPVVQGIICSVSPAQIQLSGGNSVTATLTCSVPGPSSSTSTSQILPRRWPNLGPRNRWWKMSGMLAALALVLWLLPVRLRLRRFVYACLLLGTISFVMGCGGGNAGGGGGGGSATPTSTTITVPSTKVSGSNLAATVQVTGTNSPTGSVSFGVVGESYSFNTAPLMNGAAQFSYYLGAPGAFLMTAQYSGDSRNLPSQVHTPLSVVQTGMAGNVTVNAIIGPTLKQTSVALTIQ